jgi:hypothetical protein
VSSISSAIAVCLWTAQIHPATGAAPERVDLVEINHFHDEQARLVFDQIIFYEWSPTERRYHIRDWRLLKTAAQVPLRNWRDGDFVAVWHDFKQGNVLRTVRVPVVRETWTQYDPELVEREYLSEEKRRPLERKLPPLARSTAGPQPAR